MGLTKPASAQSSGSRSPHAHRQKAYTFAKSCRRRLGATKLTTEKFSYWVFTSRRVYSAADDALYVGEVPAAAASGPRRSSSQSSVEAMS